MVYETILSLATETAGSLATGGWIEMGMHKKFTSITKNNTKILHKQTMIGTLISTLLSLLALIKNRSHVVMALYT